MNLTPEIWHLDDGTKVYMYSMLQYEYLNNLANRAYYRDVGSRQKENPFTAAIGGTGHMKKPQTTKGV